MNQRILSSFMFIVYSDIYYLCSFYRYKSTSKYSPADKSGIRPVTTSFPCKFFYITALTLCVSIDQLFHIQCSHRIDDDKENIFYKVDSVVRVIGSDTLNYIFWNIHCTEHFSSCDD